MRRYEPHNNQRAQADFCLRTVDFHTAKTKEAVKGVERSS